MSTTTTTRKSAVAVVSAEIQNEAATLPNDPIIIQMAQELKDSGIAIPEVDSEENWYFMSAASRNFAERGGIATTIGGPSAAIREATKNLA